MNFTPLLWRCRYLYKLLWATSTVSHFTMEPNDEDPAWLAACIEAVDSMPEVNLPSSSRARTDANWGKSASSTYNQRSTISLEQTSRCVTSHNPSLRPQDASYKGNSRVMNARGSDDVLPQGQASLSPQKHLPAMGRGRAMGRARRINGIGINVRRFATLLSVVGLHTVLVAESRDTMCLLTKYSRVCSSTRQLSELAKRLS